MNYDTYESGYSEVLINSNDCIIRADVNISTNEKPCDSKKDSCDPIEGNVMEVTVEKNDCQIKANIDVARKKTIRLWGQVKDCTGKAVACVLVNLVKQVSKDDFETIAYTTTDCMGFYQFDVCPPKEDDHLLILVSSPSIGKERTIDVPKCDPCTTRFEYIKY